MPGIRTICGSRTKPAVKLALLGLAAMISLSACQTEDEPEPYVPTHKWAWISGGNTVNPTGVYGTLGTPAASNVPGGREYALSWPAPDGSFWLFAGNGYDSAGYKGLLNDLWKFDTVTRQWTWVSGSSLRSQEGVYGTKGVADPANVPGARVGAVSWIDPDGKLWLFGGLGNAEAGDYGQLNGWRICNTWPQHPSCHLITIGLGRHNELFRSKKGNSFDFSGLTLIPKDCSTG